MFLSQASLTVDRHRVARSTHNRRIAGTAKPICHSTPLDGEQVV